MPAIRLEDIVFTGAVTIGSGIQLIVFAGKVYKARERYNVKYPAVTGNEDFERVFRAQQNTLECFPIYMTSLWTSALFFHQVPSAIAGVVYIYSRFKYFEGYSRSVEERLPGFYLGVKCLLAMSLMASVGCVAVLLRRHADFDMESWVRVGCRNRLGLKI